MDLFGMGFGEILLILVIALIIWGPKKIPEIANTLGKMMRTLRKATSDFTTEITRDVEKQERQHLPPRSRESSDEKPKTPSEKNKAEPPTGS